MRWLGIILLCALGLGTARAADELRDEDIGASSRWFITVDSPSGDDGTHLAVSWRREPVPSERHVLVMRRKVIAGRPTFAGLGFDPIDKAGAVLVPRFLYPGDKTYHSALNLNITPSAPGAKLGEWVVVAVHDGDPATPIIDTVEADGSYVYAFIPVIPGATANTIAQVAGHAASSDEVSPSPGWFNRTRWMHLVLIAIIAGSLFGFTWLAKRKTLFIRRLPGVDAIEDAVGRSTEMGRPILYVTGVEQAQNIETLASLLILGHVAHIAAEYDTDLVVANAFPLTMVIAEEIVRQGYANAGRADAHRPENVMFITSEQFAFAAAVNGIILRDRPATNIYFGKFYAESLMLAETGYLTGAVQIAGTAELTQLPFFVSACDYTLMGEELFACSAYLTREPNQIALLKAGDVMKVVIAVLVLTFTVFATLASQGYAPFTRFSISDILP